jgi:uncharacterized protein (TIGR02217 family)
MARINAVLDEEVDYGFSGGPRYKTNIGEYPNGFEDRDSGWKYPKHEFSASFGDVPDENRDYIIAGFHVCAGRKHSIKFKDWNDFTIEDQVIQVLPGTANPIQLYKTYAPFGPTYVRVRAVQAFAFCNIVDELGDPVAGTLDTETGIFTPAEEWTEQEYRIASAEFYVWVRYDDDYNEMTINSWRANTAKVTLKEDPFDFLPLNVPPSWDD